MNHRITAPTKFALVSARILMVTWSPFAKLMALPPPTRGDASGGSTKVGGFVMSELAGLFILEDEASA